MNPKTIIHSKKLTPLFPILLCVGLSGCNSDGSSEVKTLSGKIVDVQVEGLSYQTPSFSEKTSADGSFTYKTGETVSFFVGDIAVGETKGKAEVSLFDLAGINKPSTVTLDARSKLQDDSTIHEFDTLSNLVVFLDAVDEDGNYSNGITIPDQLNELALGKTIEIKGNSFTDFEKQLNDSKLLEDAVDAGVWSSAPDLTHAMVALDKFYQSIGEPVQLPVVTQISADLGNDGTVNSTTKMTYDEFGNKSGEYKDYNNDGDIDSQEEWTYNAASTSYHHQSDKNGNDIFESANSAELVLHDNGVTASETQTNEFYNDESGVIEYKNTQTLSYSTDGQLSKIENWSQSPNYDGQSTSIYTRDADGRLTKLETDNGSDGSIDKIETHQFNEETREVVSEIDEDADGVADEISYATYDENFKILTSSKDSDANGEIDSLETTAYDTNGNTIKITSEVNGVLISTIDQSYNAAGNMLSRSVTNEENTDYNTLETYQYSAEGNPKIHSIHNWLNGVKYLKYQTFFNENYGHTSTEYDEFAEVINTNSTTRNEQGKLLESSSYNYQDGVESTSRVHTYTYNSDDRLSTETDTLNGTLVDNKNYNYDEDGKLTSVVDVALSEDGSGNTESYIYENVASWRALYDSL